MKWTDERVALLVELVDNGLSASQAAARLGGDVTRNAVIGKMHRMGKKLKGQVRKPRKVRTPKARKVKFVPTTVAALTPLPPVGGCTLMELTPSACRWPEGNPATPSFRFCGARRVEGLPYCAEHCRRAYKV